MLEAIETPYGLSSAFHPTRRDAANGGPCWESCSCMPAALLHLQLRLPQHVELDGRDPEGAGLLHCGAVGRRVCDDHFHLTAPGRAVVVQEIVDVALQERDFGRQRRRSE